MKNSVTTNYRRNSDNSSEQIQRIVIWTEIMIQSIMNLIFCEIFEQRTIAKNNKIERSNAPHL